MPALNRSEKERKVSIRNEGVVNVGDSAVVDDSVIPPGAVQVGR